MSCKSPVEGGASRGPPRHREPRYEIYSRSVGAAVLIVDDDADLLRTLARRFHLAGFRVAVAKDGVEALAKFGETTPAIVVTDILMPNREGVETIIEMKSRAPEVKILAISGGGLLGAASVLDLARRLGADAV